MFLNDAFDAAFDKQYRKERPIPSGAISLRAAWGCGFACLIIGVAGLFMLTIRTGLLGVILAGCILLYDGIHKRISFAPLLMGACRFLLYLVAASTFSHNLPARAVWGGIALACYIVGLSYVARRESAPGALQYWPLPLLAAPIMLAFLTNLDGNSFGEDGLIVSLIFGVWAIKCLRFIFRSGPRDIGRAVSGLLAGIVLVDWLAVANAPKPLGLVFIALFLLALLFQRFIPAT